MIFAAVKVLHLLALLFGAAASLGNVYVLLAKGPHDLPAPGFLASLRNWYRLTALAAILILWVTGILLTFLRYGWAGGFAFNAKLFLAAALLGLVGFVNFMAPRWARRGGPPPYLAALHVAGAAIFLAATFFAVIAFA